MWLLLLWLFCVLRRSSAAPRFFRVKPIWFFSTKKRRRKLASKGKVKCGRRARPNGLASRVKHHLAKGKKGEDFANKRFNTFSYHRKGITKVQKLQSRPKKEETKKWHKEKKKTYFWYILNMASSQAKGSSPDSIDQAENSLEQKKTT